MLSSNNTSQELRESGVTTAIIPIGGTEQCGPTLPCALDSIVADRLSRYCAEALDVYLAPLLPYNTSQEHSGFAGTLSLSAPLLTAVVQELVLELMRQGYNKLIILSPHGGSYWLPPLIKTLNYQYKDVIIISGMVGAEKSMAKAYAASGLPKRPEMHGGVMTVAAAYHFCPELVRPGNWKAEIDPSLMEYKNYGIWDKIAPNGAWGSFTEEDAKLDLKSLGAIFWKTFHAEQAQAMGEHLRAAAKLKGISE
jgi:creatinine amidohydrolase